MLLEGNYEPVTVRKPARSAASLPSIPTASIRERITELGYGSGPWSRIELSERWGASLANKVIDEAKEAGWLISPFRSQYFVPPARDLMVAAWLPPPQRLEFVISRSLAATGLRYWCLSAWARPRGVLFPSPAFVTDLRLARGADATRTTPLRDLMAQSKAQAASLKRIPYLENTIIVPLLGELSQTSMKAWVSLPAKPKKKPSKELTGDWTLTLIADEMANGGRFGPTYIDYSIGRGMDEPAWVIALLTALGLPRLRELIPRIVEETKERAGLPRGGKRPKPPARDLFDDVSNWGAFFGPPALNENWQAVLKTGSFPYTLVPQTLWEETISAATSRAFEETKRLRKDLNA